MQFVGNVLNKRYLQNILPEAKDEVSEVLAAIAYGGQSTNEKGDFISQCVANGYRLDIWMRYDHTVPVEVRLLRKLLANHHNNIFCKLIPDVLHSKVIWWKGYGAYIGSANLTDRAWLTNIEAGIFLNESDLQTDGMEIELENFFDELKNLPQAFELNSDVIKEMEQLEQERAGIHNKGKALRQRPVLEGLAFIDKRKAADKRKERFQNEWSNTLGHLTAITMNMAAYRPVWVAEQTPLEWQTDQFLHAYYYNHIGENNSKPIEKYFTKNRANPNAALNTELNWWKSTTSAPSREDKHLIDYAPYIRTRLAKNRILNLTIEDFEGVCERTHATRDHISKIRLADIGHPDLESLSILERIPLFARWLMSLRNKKGWSVLNLLHYVLYEGKPEDAWERLYNAAYHPDYRLSHYGLNSIAELIGWARPEIAPPRNGRTSKALRALGYDVVVY